MEALLQLLQNEMTWVVVAAGLSLAGVPVFSYVKRVKSELIKAKTEIEEAKQSVEEIKVLIEEVKTTVKK